MKHCTLFKSLLLVLLALTMIIGCVACGNGNNPAESADESQSESIGESQDESVGESTPDSETQPDAAVENTYDFYLTLGTMPTLYATLNAYAHQNPNTYMWFLRGNTISKEYSADFIHYFDTQSDTNASSTADWAEVRNTIAEILADDPDAKFHLYCDDLRVSFIPYLFVWAGVDFEDMQVTLLSDGTGTYHNYSLLTDSKYESYAETWQSAIDKYTAARDDETFVADYEDGNTSMMQMQHLAFYVSTFDNVEFWIQSPDYLTTTSAVVTAARENMNIVEKNPALMYQNLSDEIRAEYQKVVLANALVDSDTLTTLDEAVAYFDGKLSGRDKELVLILGTNKKTLDENKFYIDSTLAYYTPTVSEEDATKVVYKGKTYDITEGATTVTVDGKELTIGELGVYLFFKGHPAHPADATLQAYFAENGIEMLPHRTPVETLFWMYDVKAGGYQSTSFLSCYKGQTEFLYEVPDTEAIVQMMEAGFFEGTAIFVAPVEETDETTDGK